MENKTKNEKKEKKNYLGAVVGIIAFIVVFGVVSQLTKSATTSVITNTGMTEDEAYIVGFKPSFVSSCVTNYTSQNPDNQKANSYCNCLVDKMVNNYSVQELKDMSKSNNLINDKTAQFIAECSQ